MREDFAICGYCFKGNGRADLILGAYQREHLLFAGTVELPVAAREFRKITGTDSVSKGRYCEMFPEFPGTDWLSPELVCSVEHSQRIPGIGLQDSAFGGLSAGKSPSQCYY